MLEESFTLPVGTVFHTIDADTLYTPGFTHYVTYRSEDVDLYRVEFTKELKERLGNVPVYDILTKAVKPIRVLGYDDAKELFNQLYLSDSMFRIPIDCVHQLFLDSFQQNAKVTTLNEREQKVLSLLERNEPKYDCFVVELELSEPVFRYPFIKFVDTLYLTGYNAILDIADVRYNSYTPKAPLILFDPASVEIFDIIKVSK